MESWTIFWDFKVFLVEFRYNLYKRIIMAKKEKKYKNFLLLSLSGMFFSGAESSKPSTLTEKEIQNTIFNGHPIKKSIISKDDFDIEGFTEDIWIYFDASETDVWNYNPVLSLQTGELVYSSVALFVTESVFMDSKNKSPMKFEVFKDICQSFYDSAQNALDKENDQETEEEPIVKTSTLFEVSDIRYHIGGGMRFEVEKDEKLDNLDRYYKENYVQEYHPDLCSNDVWIKNDKGKPELASVLIKQGLFSIVNQKTGAIDNYFFPSFTKEMEDEFKKGVVAILEKYQYSDKDEDEIRKEMEKERKEFRNKFFQKYSS